MSCTSPTMGKHVQRFGGLTCLNWISTFAKEFSLSSLRVSTLGQFRKFYTHNEFSNFHSTASEWTIDIKHRISLNSFLHLASNGQFFHRFWVFYTLLLSEMFFFLFLMLRYSRLMLRFHLSQSDSNSRLNRDQRVCFSFLHTSCTFRSLRRALESQTSWSEEGGKVQHKITGESFITTWMNGWESYTLTWGCFLRPQISRSLNFSSSSWKVELNQFWLFN